MIKLISERRAIGWGAAMVVALALGGCGGGDSPSAAAAGDTATVASVPDSALATPQAFMTFELSLKADDHSEPMQMNATAAPTDDKAEATAVGI